MANEWLEMLKQELGQHNTAAASRKADTVGTPAGGEKASLAPSKNRHTSKKVTDKTDKNNITSTKDVKKTKKRTKKKKLTAEEEETHYDELAAAFPAYVHTEERARKVLEWTKQVPELALDIETYGRLKRDGLLYTRCQVRLLQLHHGGASWFIDCNHVPDEITTEILLAIKDKPKYLHNALFDIPRLYRRFGVLLDDNVHDTLIASRVARAGEWERKKGRVTQISHSLVLQRHFALAGSAASVLGTLQRGLIIFATP
jgi:hypothetical protein